MFTPEEQADLKKVAEKFGIKSRCLMALGVQESQGRSHWEVGGKQMPAIRPETHHFYKQLAHDPAKQQRAVRQGLAHPKRGAIKLPRSYEGRYRFFGQMMAIDKEAACAATSWGWGQVMGFNAEALGYHSATDLANTAMSGFAGQTEIVVHFLQTNGLVPFLNNIPDRKSVETFARRYNGPKWKENNYATELIQAWKTLGEMDVGSQSTRRLQETLSQLGYETGKIDGDYGPVTKAAVRKFQEDNGLVVDGKAGPMTWETINDKTADMREKKAADTKSKTGAGATGIASGLVLMQVIEYASGVRDSVMGFFDGFGITGTMATVGVAAIVGVVVYYQFFRGGNDDTLADR